MRFSTFSVRDVRGECCRTITQNGKPYTIIFVCGGLMAHGNVFTTKGGDLYLIELRSNWETVLIKFIPELIPTR
jgi:hypothetical protein